jgi:hypothetical protein
LAEEQEHAARYRSGPACGDHRFLSTLWKKGFALRQAVNWSYESVVQQRNTYEDLLWTFGVSYEKRK